VNGAFSHIPETDSVFRIKASHLGCFFVDTVLKPARNHKIVLTPFSYDLPEVVVRQNVVERSVQMGEAPGLINLNSYITVYLPGNGDNTVFNLLRLQPGVVAAGEQPNDLILWGSYEGTSKVKYDGITIWGLKNFSDNISAVNPFMSKSVEVFKGGYDATRDDLVGGVVNITGKTGRRDRPGINLFVNNETLNRMVETPLSDQSSLVLAYRQTYDNLFEPEDVDLGSNRDLQYRIDVQPEYRFRDYHAKYSWQGDDGSLFYISTLFGDDDFSYTAKQERQQNIITQNTSEENHQYGGAMFWGKKFKTGGRFQFHGSWSALNSTYGVDVFVKKDFHGNTFWTACSLGRAEELFPYFPDQQYRRALHDQRHELKVAGLVRLFKNFHVSGTYIFGTGFPLYANFLSEKYVEPDYSRLDLALVYRLSVERMVGELGFSLLNALDHYNVKYTSFEQVPLDQLNTA